MRDSSCTLAKKETNSSLNTPLLSFFAGLSTVIEYIHVVTTIIGLYNFLISSALVGDRCSSLWKSLTSGAAAERIYSICACINSDHVRSNVCIMNVRFRSGNYHPCNGGRAGISFRRFNQNDRVSLVSMWSIIKMDFMESDVFHSGLMIGTAGSAVLGGCQNSNS